MDFPRVPRVLERDFRIASIQIRVETRNDKKTSTSARSRTRITKEMVNQGRCACSWWGISESELYPDTIWSFGDDG